MAKANATLGKGTKVEFLDFGFIGQGTDLDFSDMGTIDDIEVTNFDSDQPSGDTEWGGMEYEPGACGDPGTISMTLVYDQDQSLPPFGRKGAIRLTLPVKQGYATGVVYGGDGYLKSASLRAEAKGVYTQTVTIRASGKWTKVSAKKVA